MGKVKFVVRRDMEMMKDGMHCNEMRWEEFAGNGMVWVGMGWNQNF
jgi:hypothetical protein